MKKTVVLWILSLLFAISTVGVVVSAATTEPVNGWGTGTNIETVDDIGNGYTAITGGNANSIACATPLNVQKPIIFEYWMNARDGDDWTFFGFASSFENAKAVDNEIYTVAPVNRDKYPFVHMHNSSWIWDGAEGALQNMISDRLETDYLSLAGFDRAFPTENVCFEIEIYFGQTAEQGYMLINGLFVGRPSATQTSFANGEAFLFVNGWRGNEWVVKVSQTDTIKAISGSNHIFMFDSKLNPLKSNVAQVKFEKESHQFGVMGDAEDIRFTVETNVLYTLNKIQFCGFTNESGSWKPAFDAENNPILSEDGEGVYTVNNRDTNYVALIFDMKMDETLHEVSLVSEGVKAWIKDSVNVLKEGETLTYVVEPLSFTHHITEISYKIGDAEPISVEISERREYKLTCPEDIQPGAPIVITAKGKLNEVTDPSEATVKNSVNGWDINSGDEKYGAIWSNGVQRLFDVGDGSAFMTLDNSGSISNTSKLDVTKPIYLDLLVKPNGEPSQGDWWFMVTLWDDFEVGVKLGAEVYGGNGLPYYDIPAMSRGKFAFSFLKFDMTSGVGSAFGDSYDAEALSKLTNRFGDAWEYNDDEQNYNSGTFSHIEIYFGATNHEDGYVKVDGVKVGTPAKIQADFERGGAYLHLSTFYTANVRAKLYQETTFDYTTGIDEHAHVELVEPTNLEGLLAYDQVKFKITYDEGYVAKSVRANGVELVPDKDGYYYYRVAFGGAKLIVESGKKVTVSFEENGGSEVDSVIIGEGGILTKPTSEKKGYEVVWCTDAALTTPFDFSVGIVKPENGDEIILYAKWTPIEYVITYYDDVNKIRDLQHNSYTIESSFELETYEKEGCVFEGWYTNPQFTGERVTKIEKGSTGEIVLYAKFSQQGAGCSGTYGIMQNGAGVFVGLTALSVVAFVICKKSKER